MHAPITDARTQAHYGNKALAVAALAVSEASLGNEDAACTAAYRAGVLVYSAGMPVAQLAAEVADLAADDLLWGQAVDGWYDAAERRA